MPVAKTPADQKFLDNVEKFGWVVPFIFPNAGDEYPDFHYSCGIYKRTAKPELIVFGLRQQIGHFVVNEYANRVSAGEEFIPCERYEGFVGNWPVIFVDNLDRKVALEHLTWTDWFYDREPFPILQCVLPDPSNGKFPWEQGYRDPEHKSQPLLFPITRFTTN